MTSPADAAAALRAARDEVVAAISAGTVAIGSLGDDARAIPVKVVVLAQAVPGVGKVASRRVLEALGIDDATRWGEIEPAARAALADGLAAAVRARGA